MTAEIRRARPGEEAAVSRLLAEVWHATHDVQLGRDKVAEITAKWHAPALLRAQIDDPEKCFLVAEAADGGLVGHAMSWLDDGDTINLLRLYVLPGWQGRGLGSRLLAAAVAACPAGRLLRLEVQAQNAPAIRFYERMGLRAAGNTGKRGGFTDIPALVMEKPLPLEGGESFS
jgi:ribosomal protein S18 acetylase RimI-like enzyme